MSVIHIRNLADAPQHVEEVSRWLWEQWARADGYSLEDIVYRTRHAMRRRGVPQMLVAEEDGAPVSMLYALPVTLAHGERAEKAAYLYAVADEGGAFLDFEVRGGRKQ